MGVYSYWVNLLLIHIIVILIIIAWFIYVSDWQQFVTDNLRGWQQLNMDWLYNFTGPTHVIFYEQLVDNTEHTLKTVINFLGVYVPAKKLECAIERKEGIYR